MDPMTPTQIDQLNRSMPAAKHVGLGDRVAALESAQGGQEGNETALAARVTALETNFNALLAKLDADDGVTDTDYASTLAVGEEE